MIAPRFSGSIGKPVKQLSGVIITFNEAEKVRGALESLRSVCDEIVVVDSFSRDATPEICRRYADRFVQREWSGYKLQKRFATDLAAYDWILSLDADERLSSPLTREIGVWKERTGTGYDGYRIPRLSFFLGRWIRHGLWYPDYQMRLFRRSKGSWVGGRVHESFQVEGPVSVLQNPIYHFSYACLDEYLRQLVYFSRLAALDLQERGIRPRASGLLLSPLLVFMKSWIFKRGFLDGTQGLIVSALAAVSTFFKHAYLWEQRLGKSLSEQEWMELEEP